MERRKEPLRRRMLKGGNIVFNNRSSTIGCVVRNMTDSGARLEVPSTLGVPDGFSLESEDGTFSHNCVVKWRKDNVLGVEFTD